MTVKNIPTELELYLQQLHAYLDGENWQATIDLCDRIAAICKKQLESPQNNTPGIVYLERGDRLLQEERIADAISFYQRAISVNSNLPIARKKLALALSAYKQQLAVAGKSEEAIAIYQQTLELHPDIAEIHASLGNLYARVERWEEAISAYERAVALNPQLAKAYFNLGTICLKLGREKLAADRWYRACTLDPKLLKAKEYLNLGNLLSSQAKYDSAIDCLQRAIDLQPHLTVAYATLGKLFLQQNLVAEAIALYEQLSNRNPKDPEARILLGRALAESEQWSEAIICYRQAISLRPDLWDAYHFCGKALQKQKKWQQAEQMYRYCLEIDPGDFDSRQELIQVWLQQHKRQEIIDLCCETLNLQPDAFNAAWLHASLGNALSDIKQSERASKHLSQAARLRGWEEYYHKQYQFTRDWFTHNIPLWEKCLAEFKNLPNLNILEIGSFEGMATCWLLDRILSHRSGSITCIDPQFQINFAENIAKTQTEAKFIRFDGQSGNILPTLPENNYQIIYIDGCHLADSVEQDARLSWNLLKVGGLAIFDDYEWSDPLVPQQDPKLGIDRFLERVKSSYQIIHRGYQLIIRKIS